MHHNHRPFVLMKFGGTSLGTAQRLCSVADIVRDQVLLGYVPVVVCSAMSGERKATGTTSLLLQAAEATLQQPSSELSYRAMVDQIRDNHVAAARDAFARPPPPDAAAIAAHSSQQLLLDLEAAIARECTKLVEFLQAVEIIDEISPRSKDVIVSVGEKLSAMMVTAVLRHRGVPAISVNLDRIVHKEFDAEFLDQSFYDYLADKSSEAVLAALDSEASLDHGSVTVPVATGFLGPVPGSLLSTVGRGYTDLTAALLSVGLDAEELQIWKEVDGIFTADPRKVPTARLLRTISPDEAAELTYYGSEVIHPFTMDQVIRSGVQIRIKNTFNPSGSGTVIVPETPRSTSSNGHRRMQQRRRESRVTQTDGELGSNLPPLRTLDDAYLGAAAAASNSSSPSTTGSSASLSSLVQNPVTARSPTAVTIKDSILVINIRSNRKSSTHGFLSSIFGILDRHGVVVDMITTSEVHVSMAIPVPHTHVKSSSSNGSLSAVKSGRSSSSSSGSGSSSCSSSLGDAELLPSGNDFVLGGAAYLSVDNPNGGQVHLPRHLEKVLAEFQRLGAVSYVPRQVILSVVGKHMRNMVGTAGKMFSILAADGINIEMISQGASEINISCVIGEHCCDTALRSVHDRLVCGVVVSHTSNYYRDGYYTASAGCSGAVTDDGAGDDSDRTAQRRPSPPLQTTIAGGLYL
ncbi:Aspartokinase [Sorochytrium milnesiophthora]